MKHLNVLSSGVNFRIHSDLRIVVREREERGERRMKKGIEEREEKKEGEEIEKRKKRATRKDRFDSEFLSRADHSTSDLSSFEENIDIKI